MRARRGEGSTYCESWPCLSWPSHGVFRPAVGGIRTASGRQPPHHPVMQRATEGPPRDGAVRNGRCLAPRHLLNRPKRTERAPGRNIRFDREPPGSRTCVSGGTSHQLLTLASFNHRYILDATTGRLSPARTGQAKLGHPRGFLAPAPVGPQPAPYHQSPSLAASACLEKSRDRTPRLALYANPTPGLAVRASRNTLNFRRTTIVTKLLAIVALFLGLSSAAHAQRADPVVSTAAITSSPCTTGVPRGRLSSLDQEFILSSGDIWYATHQNEITTYPRFY